MKTFLLGLIVGIFLAIIIYYTPGFDPKLRIRLGRLLDKDIIFLKNGNIVRGWIFKESDEEFLVELEKGYFRLPRSECETIEKNYLLQYMQELI